MWVIDAWGGPEDARTTAEDVALRRLEADAPLGAPRDPRFTATLLDGADPLAAAARAWYPADDRTMYFVRPTIRAGVGVTPRAQAGGDVTDQGMSARVGAEGRLYHGALEARAAVSVGLDAIPGISPVLRVDGLRLGVRSRGAWLAISQESRWFGPGRHGALLYSDHGDPLPAVDVGATARLPGKATVLGRFSGRLLVGYLPGERRDVARPGWLMLDLRWQPVPWIEIGLERNSIFGGVGRPVDVGQIMLPTSPHVYDDPQQLQADTDERAAVDIRISAPIGRWGMPGIDVFELYFQQGGEDVIARRAGPIPVPSLAGVANLYGVGIYAGPWLVNGELAVIADDVFRWYVGHRIYHEGWTKDGLSLGHPSGGDSRTTSLRVAYVAPAWVADVAWLGVGRVQVLDRVDDTVFVASERERRDTITASVARLGATGGTVGASLSVGHVRHEAFVAGADAWQAGATVFVSPALVGRGASRD